MASNMSKPPYELDPKDPLSQYWNRTVEALARVGGKSITPEETERQEIYSLLTMALVHSF